MTIFVVITNNKNSNNYASNVHSWLSIDNNYKKRIVSGTSIVNCVPFARNQGSIKKYIMNLKKKM